MSEPRKRPLKIGIMLPESEREMAGDTAGWGGRRRRGGVGGDSATGTWARTCLVTVDTLPWSLDGRRSMGYGGRAGAVPQ